jgi:hypothetical protein
METYHVTIFDHFFDMEFNFASPAGSDSFTLVFE